MWLQYGHGATTLPNRLASVCCHKLWPLIHLPEIYHAGTHYEMNSSGRPPAFATPPPARTFPFAETPSNTPFLFHPPASITPPPAGFWKLPQDFSPEKAFPPVVETADVSMNDVTSNPGSIKKESKKDASTDAEGADAVILARKVSTNAVKRVIKGRRRAHNRIANRSVEKADEQESESETEDEGYTRESSINHHYTFNIPGLPVDRSELPYMLLGCVESITISVLNLMEFTTAMYSFSSTSLLL